MQLIWLTSIFPPVNSCFLLYAAMQYFVFWISIKSTAEYELSFVANPISENFEYTFLQ